MIKKCSGCGAMLQYDKPELAGYIESDMYEKASICRRCFRLKSYGDYVFINKDNEEYINILKSINNTHSLVLYLVDLFNINNSIKDINKYLNNPIILVLTKRDILPKSVRTSKIIDWLKEQDHKIIDIIDISSEKNYNMDRLYNSIKKHKKTNDIYVVGNTNAGKSTLVNKLIKNYSNNSSNITTSMLPSTTLEMMEIKLNEDITLFDTPGLLDSGSIINNLDYGTLRKITPRKEIKPRTYQMTGRQSLLIDSIARIDQIEDNTNSFTIYLSNDLEVERINLNTNDKLRKLAKNEIKVNDGEDVIINGLCWIKIVKRTELVVYVKENVEVFTRKSII
ncbi:MAG: 50S ribosome-binding GTPase [Bacilli bacterium]|nr:50S ribosome-binding GTPase [Bacilli bacterium]